MAETIVSAELDEEVVPSSYTSETESAPAGAGQSITEVFSIFAWY